ncbi:KEOPS complex Pcc1-like subunit [Natronolimnobius sp. AArcel1]|uniref:KEOPS complex subunit Pcc1 n=1 Tax=Natronolimnobius sp. AArcel1 TaxID=1679093 RepID=UPI0013EBA360|nr:KEOPS complex subunit Pcc1 [Natronolimnobius sp. AArcel1]NGM71100.1 KEOPS complex Pcc1-like subunit [Natronolimnobius sp. AArcel1]
MSRRASATIRTVHDTPERLARALRPDNTDEMETVVDGDTLATTIQRDSTSGLQATADDYVVNLEVALEVLDRGVSGTVDSTDGRGRASDADYNTNTTTNE